MADYTVLGPDGKEYTIQGPANATDEQILSAAEELLGPRFAKPEPITQDVTPQAPTPETESEGTMQEIAEGVASGLLAIPQGIGELGASVGDLVMDTNYTQDVTDAFNTVRVAAGIDPVGLPAEIAEIAAQFVVPGVAAASAVSKARLLANADKFVRGAAQVGAAGVVDAMVATDGTTTIGDFFGGGPTQTTDLIGLEGRQRALASMGNKAKLGLEAAGAVTLVEPVLKGLGLAGSLAMKGATPVAAPVARAALQAGTSLSTGAEKAANFFGVADQYDQFLSVFRSRGNLPEDVFEAQSAILGKAEAEATEAATVLKELENNLNEAYKGVETVMLNGTALTRAELNNNLFYYLTGEAGEEVLPEFLKSPALKMRSQVDKLSNKIINSEILSREGSEGLVNQIKSNLGSYLRRKYRLFEDGGYKKTEEFAQARLDTISLFEQSPKTFRSFWERVKGDDVPIPDDLFVGVGSSERVLRSAAENLVDEFVEISGRKRSKLASLKGTSRTAVNKLKLDMFQAKTVNEPTIRRLLGEIKDPQEAYISTVADLAEFSATDDFLDFIARNASDSGEILTNEAFMSKAPALRQDYELLNEDYWGSAQGLAVSRNMYKDLTRITVGDLNTMGNLAVAAYSGFLRAKGASQFGKTVLSPITQVRNVSSAGLFALAQGNVGANSKLMESFATVIGNISKRPDRLEYYTNLQRLGVVGTQAQIREIDRLLREGLGVTREADEVVAGVRVGNKGNMFTRSKFGEFLKSGTGKAREFYQGGDDVWKIYNFEFEKQKLLSKFGSKELAEQAVGKNLDEYAADIVKNTVPNYERVPQIIKGLRKLPLGNFIAFPAEVMRTSANTLKQALDELASDSPQLREIGMRRLTGLTATTMIAPTAIQGLAMSLAGVSQEQMDAVRRSAPPWSRNSRLLPTSTDKDGNVTGYVDYSYTNPYDYLQRPIQGIFNAVKDGQDIGKDTGAIAFNAIAEATTEMFSPFLSESIIAERVLDATTRNGQTKTGLQIYRDVDTTGTKAAKSLVHIMEAFNPGGSPIVLKAQAKETQMPGIELGRFARSFTNQNVDPAGNERLAANELLRALTGITEVEVKPDNIVMYSSYEYGRNMRSARQMFNSAARTRGEFSDTEATNAFRNANEALFRVQNEMYQVVKDMERLGMKRSEIRRALEKYKIGNVRDLMRGRFVPMDVSSEVKKQVRENGNRLPMSELRAIRREFRSRRLGEQVQEPQVQETRSSDLSSAAPAQQPTSQPVAQATPTQVQQPVAQTQTAQVDPALLGSNPIDALKNQQIAARRAV